MQLARLPVESIAASWPKLRDKIEGALPPISYESPDRSNKILESLLSGRLHCLVLYEAGKGVTGIVVVDFMTHFDSDHRTMFIYTLHGTGIATGKDWVEMIGLIKGYAKSQGCRDIAALSKSPSVIKIAQILGGSADYRLIQLEV